MEQISLQWQGGMEYTTDLDNHQIRIDASPELGGANLGPRPKALMLVALAGCTGMDIASLARKMRVEIEKLTIDVDADKSEIQPVVYTAIRLKYRFTAPPADRDKIIKMVTLSQERYCGVAAMLRPTIALSYEIELNEESIF